MVRTPRPADERRTLQRIVRAGACVVLAGVLSSALPTLTVLAQEEPSPSPVAKAVKVRLNKPSVPVRIRVPYAGIDLPVISSKKNVPGNRPGYPLCDVAQYWTKYDLPGAPGTTWLLAHAQDGMFLPLFTISENTDGKGLMGKIVELQLKDGRLLRYRINKVKERALDQDIADRNRAKEHRLILQTSTGPPGTEPKLQVAAKLVSATRTDDPAPKANPRACWQPRPKATPRNKNGTKPTPEPTIEVIEPEEPLGAMTLVLGGGAILLGATFVAIYLVRREP